MRRIASFATNKIIPAGAKRQVRNREVVSYTFLSLQTVTAPPSLEKRGVRRDFIR